MCNQSKALRGKEILCEIPDSETHNTVQRVIPCQKHAVCGTERIKESRLVKTLDMSFTDRNRKISSSVSVAHLYDWCVKDRHTRSRVFYIKLQYGSRSQKKNQLSNTFLSVIPQCWKAVYRRAAGPRPSLLPNTQHLKKNRVRTNEDAINTTKV